MIEPNEDIRECPQCKSNKIILDTQRASLICSDCGSILLEDISDTGPEWRAFDQREKRSKKRTGPATSPMIHDKGLSTYIDKGKRNGKGRYLNPDDQQKAYKLRKWQSRTRQANTEERSVAFAVTEIGKITSQLSLPKVVAHNASTLYREANDNNLVRGRSKEAVVAACTYAACRINRVPRTMREIAGASPVSSKEMRKSYQVITRELNLDVPIFDPVEFAYRFGKEMELDDQTIAEGEKLIRRAKEKKLTVGRNPRGIVGACLYIASMLSDRDYDLSQSGTAEYVGVTEVTIRNRYKEIKEELNIDLNG